MYRILPALADTYITDKIIDSTFRATDANVGHAATLDLFKLFDENTLTGSAEQFEHTRLLIKFDLNAVRALTGSIIDIADSSFKASIVLSDVIGGQPTPSNFTVVVHPMSRSWDEGVGRDVGRFSDLDAANWVTASVSSGLVLWTSGGAGAVGALGQTGIDAFGSGNLNDGLGFRDLFKTQVFSTGQEDLEVDVTDIVSATLAGALPDAGFRIAFSGSFETNSGSLFVKRFGARHASSPTLRPKLVVKFDESIRDNHNDFVFDTTGSLYLFNSVRGVARNFVSGAAGTQLVGTSSLTLKLISGAISPAVSQSFSTTVSVNQFRRGSNYVSGAYVATFALSSYTASLRREVELAGSATFHTVWGSNDGTVPYLTGTLVVRSSNVGNAYVDDRQFTVSLPNIRQTYKRTSVPRIRVDVFDVLPENSVVFSKLPLQRVSETIDTMYWRLVDVYAGEVVIPFDRTDDATRVSVDSGGMFFDFYPQDLNIGRVYGFEFLIVDGGEEIVVDRGLPTFRIEP